MTTLTLKKGEKLSLSKVAPALVNATVGLGWDARVTAGADFDLDASAFLLDANGKAKSDAAFIYYNQPVSQDGSVRSTGDNRTGSGPGDDEQIKVDLSKVPADVAKIAFVVTIYDFEARKQNFGQVSNAYVRIVDDATGNEVARFDLSEDFSTETGVVFAELYRQGAEWKFAAVGQGYAGGLGALANQYGLNIS
jgi:tellurium resistance protein TerD